MIIVGTILEDVRYVRLKWKVEKLPFILVFTALVEDADCESAFIDCLVKKKKTKLTIKNFNLIEIKIYIPE